MRSRIAVLLVACGCMADEQDVIEQMRHADKKAFASKHRELYWDCHNDPVGHVGPPITAGSGREVPIWQGECYGEYPSCNPYWNDTIMLGAHILAYTYDQARSCGAQRCERIMSSWPLYKFQKFELHATPVDWIDEPDTWWQLIPFVGQSPAAPVIKMPLCGGRLFR